MDSADRIAVTMPAWLSKDEMIESARLCRASTALVTGALSARRT